MHRKIVPDIKEKHDKTMDAESSILDAAKVMADKNIGVTIIVNKSSNIVGIVTERDMTQRVLL